MSDDHRLMAGARLASDLKRIRELRDLTLSDMNAETKIPRSLLESFEEHALFDHSQFNRVYLRSFVRTYATTVGVEPELAADALEQAFEGNYDHDLARRYLGDEDPGAVAPADDDEVSQMETSSTIVASEDAQDGGADRVASGTDDPAEAEPDEGAWYASSPPARKVSKEESEEIRPPVRPRRSPSRQSGVGTTPILVGIVVIAAIAVIAWLVVGSSDDDGERASVEDQSVELTDEVAEEPVAVSRPIPTLGDSLIFFIVAESGSVAPIRVTVDDDLRRPYWIDQGDSLRFAAANRIIFEERLDVIRLNFLGETYPTDQRDDRGRIVVTRDAAESFLQNLQP